MALASDTSMRSAYVRSNHCHWRLVLLAGCLTCATLFYNNCCVQAEQGVVMLPTCDTCDPNMPCAGPDLRTCPCFPGERQILTFYYHRVQGTGMVRCYFFGCFPNNSTMSSRCDEFYAKCCDIGGDSNCSSWTKSILAKESEGLRQLDNTTASVSRGPNRTCWRHTVTTTMPTNVTVPTTNTVPNNVTVPTTVPTNITVPTSVPTTSPLEGSATTATSHLEGSATTPAAIETPPLRVTTVHPVKGAQKDTFRFSLIPAAVAMSMVISVVTFIVVYLTCSRGRHVKRGITGWRQLHYTCSLKKKLGLQVQPLDSEELNQDQQQQQQQQQCDEGIFEEISLGDQIGSGQFADWHRGIWRGQMVTLKLFKATAGEQFDREVQHSSIYMMRHESIALYHDAGQRRCSTTIATTTSTTTNDKDATAADAETVCRSIQPWIIMQYHPNGSLFDFLSRYCYPDVPADERLGIEDMRQMTLSIGAGLMHLHSHVQGQYFGCKPSIAHRNLKSKNILVKQDGTCCISDLSLAISRDNKEDGEHYVNENGLMVGEARYKAPEVLDGSISRSSFEEFRAADVYSLALIIWELAHACSPANGSAPAYSKPYADSIPEVPSSKDVYEAVCIRKCRPPLPKHWLENEVLSVIHRIINTSWKEHGQKRFSANRIWRNVQALETVKVKRPDNTVT